MYHINCFAKLVVITEFQRLFYDICYIQNLSIRFSVLFPAGGNCSKKKRNPNRIFTRKMRFGFLCCLSLTRVTESAPRAEA